MTNPYEGKITLSEKWLPVSANEGRGNGSQSVSDFVSKYSAESVYEATGDVIKVRLMP